MRFVLLSIFTLTLQCASFDTLYIIYVVSNGLPKNSFPILYPKYGTGGSLHPFLCHFNTDNMTHILLFSFFWLKRVLLFVLMLNVHFWVFHWVINNRSTQKNPWSRRLWYSFKTITIAKHADSSKIQIKHVESTNF